MKNSFLMTVSFVATLASAGAALAEDSVKFGFVMPYSGWFQPIDAGTINGAMLAIKEINAKGGVLGQQIEAVTFDNKSEPLLGADGALEVIGKGAKALLVTSDFDFGAPAAFVAQQNGVLAFAGASDAKFGATGIGPMAYSISTDAEAQAAMMAEWAYEDQGWKTAYLLLDDTIAMTKSLCANFETRWTALAGEGALVGRDTFLNSDASIAAQVSRINAMEQKPDLVFLCSYAPGGPSAIRQLRAGGLDMPILTGEAMDGDYWAGAVPDLNNFYVPSFGSIYGDDTDPALEDFFKRYAAEFGSRADNSYAVRGYSAVEAWAKAAEKAGSVEPEAVSAALDTFQDEPLLIGPTSFSATDRIAFSRPMTIIQAQNGSFSIKAKVAAQPRAN